MTLYMPSHRRHPEAAQDPIRFKNLLGDAEHKLVASGMRKPEARDFLQPGQELLRDADFWRYQSDGLAVFLAPGESRHYRLPWRFPELAIVSNRFHVKPLLQLLARDGRFFVLALSQNQARLFEGSLESVSDVTPEDLPQGIATVLEQYELERQLQFRTGAAGGANLGGATYHGQGKAAGDLEARVREYCRKIDRALQPALQGEQAPLVLAGVDHLFPIYRDVNSYAHLVQEGIEGNPDLLSAEELHRKAWPIVEPVFQTARLEAADRYRERAGTGTASSELDDVLPAAFHGRVESLFVAVGVQRWGRFDAGTGRITVHDAPGPDDEDLLDFAAIQTFLNGGAVFAVEPEGVPGGASLAAVLRY